MILLVGMAIILSGPTVVNTGAITAYIRIPYHNVWPEAILHIETESNKVSSAKLHIMQWKSTIVQSFFV